MIQGALLVLASAACCVGNIIFGLLGERKLRKVLEEKDRQNNQ